MFETLFSKVFFILTVQLVVTLFTAFKFIQYCRKAYEKGEEWVELDKKEGEKIDLYLKDTKKNKRMLIWNFIINVLIFISLFILHEDIELAMIVFSFWSVSTGITLALALLDVDENLGIKVLAIVASITFATCMIGLYSSVDFSFLEIFLVIGLLIMIFLNILRMFFQIDGFNSKVYSFVGIIFYTLYLLFDFNRIKVEENTWENAMNIAINIYLDVVILFLEVLNLITK